MDWFKIKTHTCAFHPGGVGFLESFLNDRFEHAKAVSALTIFLRHQLFASLSLIVAPMPSSEFMSRPFPEDVPSVALQWHEKVSALSGDIRNEWSHVLLAVLSLQDFSDDLSRAVALETIRKSNHLFALLGEHLRSNGSRLCVTFFDYVISVPSCPGVATVKLLGNPWVTGE